jgi:hypothetical protein
MYFYDGCTFVGDGNYETVATYSNGEPMAIIQNNIGLIGCHPESSQSWYDKKYLEPYWHREQQYLLLQQFVFKLLKGGRHEVKRSIR